MRTQVVKKRKTCMGIQKIKQASNFKLQNTGQFPTEAKERTAEQLLAKGGGKLKNWKPQGKLREKNQVRASIKHWAHREGMGQYEPHRKDILEEVQLEGYLIHEEDPHEHMEHHGCNHPELVVHWRHPREFSSDHVQGKIQGKELIANQPWQACEERPEEETSQAHHGQHNMKILRHVPCQIHHDAVLKSVALLGLRAKVHMEAHHHEP